jgi:Flp pilus assembly protein TadD
VDAAPPSAAPSKDKPVASAGADKREGEAPPSPAPASTAETPQPSAADNDPKVEPAPQPAAEAKPGRAEAKDDKEAKPRATPYKPPPAAEPGVDYKARALKLYQAGKFREAALEYEKATQVAPSDAGAYAGLGASWLSANQPDRAILAYQRAVQLKPKVSGFHAALGRAYLQKNDRGRALAAYRKAAELDPNNQAAQNALRGLSQ